jgi:hypothetical protein
MTMEPEARRPYMPGYGIVGPDEGTGLLPWSWAAQRLTTSHDYWLATVWPDGRPHVMPVWGVYQDGSVWFSSGGDSRKARNLAVNPHATVTTDDPRQPVVVDGAVERKQEPDVIASFAAWVNAKYETDYSVEFFAANCCFRLQPVSAFGLTDEDFAGSPTRWSFPPA